MSVENVLEKINYDGDGKTIYTYLENNDTELLIRYIKELCQCDENTAKLAYIDIKMDYDKLQKHQKELINNLTPQEIARNNQIAQDWQNKPTCPTCSSQNLKKISTTSKAVNTLAFGIFGTKRNKTFHCNNCSYEW